MTARETLHCELLTLRERGVQRQGICVWVADGMPEWELLRALLTERYGCPNYPLCVEGVNVSRNTQYYNTLSGPWEHKHDYLCERWALLNYLINETE